MPGGAHGRQNAPKIRVQGEGDDTSVVIEATIQHIRSMKPESFTSIARAIREARKKTIDETKETSGFFGPFFDDLADALEGLVCPVCEGSGKVGSRKKTACPECKERKWMFPKN